MQRCSSRRRWRNRRCRWAPRRRPDRREHMRPAHTSFSAASRARRRTSRPRRLSAAVALALACASLAGAASAQAAFKPPSIRHVFVILLENEGYRATFGNPAADPYLARTLPSRGALIENYYATGHESNDNYISLVSGQPPNVENQADCPEFDNFTGAIMLSSGVESGTGCVYPAEVPNIGT